MQAWIGALGQAPLQTRSMGIAHRGVRAARNKTGIQHCMANEPCLRGSAFWKFEPCGRLIVVERKQIYTDGPICLAIPYRPMTMEAKEILQWTRYRFPQPCVFSQFVFMQNYPESALYMIQAADWGGYYRRMSEGNTTHKKKRKDSSRAITNQPSCREH